MVLSARMLGNVDSVNDFSYVQSVEMTQGDAGDIFFQLIDLTKDSSLQGYKPAGRRFMPAAAATLSVRLDNLDDNIALTRSAVQAFPTSDPSIWKISVLNTDTIRGTCALVLTLTQGGVVTYGRKECAVRIRNGLAGGTYGCL